MIGHMEGKGKMNKKFKKILITLLLAFAALTTAGCASGPYDTEQFDVSAFNSISIETIGEFIIEQGDNESLSVEAPRDFMRYLIIEVEGDTLVIRTRRGFFGGPIRRAVFTIGVKDLEEISLSGAGAIKVLSLDTETFNVNLTGAGSVEIDDLQADRLEVDLTSAGAVIIAGKVEKQYISLTGVGSYEAGDLHTEDTDILLTGAGSAVVWAEDDLDAEITGVGSISYFGSPNVYQNVSGLGSINSRGEHD